MNNQELAETILQKFIPFAFTCGDGVAYCEHPECSQARNDTHQQFDTVMRIAMFINKLED